MKKFSFVSSLSAIGLVAMLGTAHAATAPKDVKAGNYKIEPGHTQVGFSVLHFGFTHYSGVFSGASGTLNLDPQHPSASKLDVTIPTSSVQTTSERLTGELKEADWLDSTKYPTATFTSTKITPAGVGGATITGDLTLHGVTKPVTLHAHYVGAGENPMNHHYTVGFQATGVIKRSEFGVAKYVPMVSDDVDLTIAGAFESQD